MSRIDYDLETRHTIKPGDLKVCIEIGGMTYEVGHLFAYSIQTSVEEVPAFGFNNKFAIAEFKGKRSHQGTLIFNVVNQSLVHELKKILEETKNPLVTKGGFISNIKGGTFDDGNNFENETDSLVNVNNDTENLTSMELPPFNIVVLYQDPIIPTRFSMKKLIGVTIVGQSNAIGLDTINTQDTYPFVCKSVTPLLVYSSDTADFNEFAEKALMDDTDGKFISGFTY